MAAATRSIVIDAPVEKVFKTISDYDRYAEFLPEVKRVSSSGRSGNQVKVHYEVEVMKSIKYTLQMNEQPPHRVPVRLGEQQPRRLVSHGRQRPRGQLGIGRAGHGARELPHHGGATGRDPLAQQGRRALGWDEHEPPGDGIGLDGPQVSPQRSQQPLARLVAKLRGHERHELVERARRLAHHERVEQRGQVVEVAVDDRARDAGAPRHGLDRDRVEAGLGHDGLRRVEQLLAPRRGPHACD